MLGQVDVREYWIKGGHRPIDHLIVERTLNILNKTLSHPPRHFEGKYECNPALEKQGKVDCVIGSIALNKSADLLHLFGPNVANLTNLCHSTIMYDFRQNKLGGAQDEIHCVKCTNFNNRRLLWDNYTV